MLSLLISLMAGAAGLAGIMTASGSSDSDTPERSGTNVAADTPEPVLQPDPDPEPVQQPIEQPVQAPAQPQPVAAPVQDGGSSSGSDGSIQAPIGLDLSADIVAAVMQGRVSTLELPLENVADVRMVSGPEYGNVSVNPDNTLAVVLTGTTDMGPLSFKVAVTFEDGAESVLDMGLDVIEGTQDAGWGTGHHYTLATDENDRSIIEHGDNHQKIYVSGHEEALTLADIAALEGIEVSDIGSQWFLRHPDYGRSEDMAVAEDAAQVLWSTLNSKDYAQNSNWLLFERGYEYEELGQIMPQDANGESELHPIYIGAYGEGDKPIINDDFFINGGKNHNIVIEDLDFRAGVNILNGTNILIEDLDTLGHGFNFQNVDNITLRHTEIIDAFKDEPLGDDDIWSPHINRTSGIYANNTTGLLIEDVLVDHVGWSEDYREDLSIEGGQPPSIYSQNIYINWWNEGVTLRDTISMRAASYGAQVRSGGFIEDNLFLDNNAAVSALSGEGHKDAPTSHYTLYSGNVITSGAHKSVDSGPKGALTKGLSHAGYDTGLYGNIITHLADPNNPDEIAEKYVGHDAIKGKDPHYDDTIVYNWVGVRDSDTFEETNQNIDGLDTDVLDQTTIQNFAAQLLGQETATIGDLADFLRLQADGTLDKTVDADVINAFFQSGFGIDTELRGTEETLRFVPADLGEGVRWDNRLNWSTEDLPSTQDGDSVDLGGNWVVYGGTTDIEHLGFGPGGQLDVGQGYLSVLGQIVVDDAGAELNIDAAGQFWAAGNSDVDRLDVNAGGGRFVNTGLWNGTTDMAVSDSAQAILATGGADYIVTEDSSLTLAGADIRAGFDGTDGDTATLLLTEGAELTFVAEDGGLGQISEFRSGRFGDETTDIQSGVNLGGADLLLDLNGMLDTTSVETLINVDEIIGAFGSVSVVGLSNTRDATLMVDYSRDTVELMLSDVGTGSGTLNLATTGEEGDAAQNDDLWQALTDGHGVYSEDTPPYPVEDIDDVMTL